MQSPMSPFTWGANGEQLTPEQLASRQRIAGGRGVSGLY